MTKPLEDLTVAELRDMVVSLESQLCDLYAQREAETTTADPGATPALLRDA